MAIFLNRYGIDNYKVASVNHVWNAVKLDGKWYHLDLTWDDPIMEEGKDVVLHDYFLIDTEELFKQDKTQHMFNAAIYKEAYKN
jgi:transglutaminase/protease-like cytokinesis protein 3